MENQSGTGTTGNSSPSVTTHSCAAGEIRSSQRNPRKDKRVGPKRPFTSGHIWEARQYLKLKGRIRDLALFNLGIDSKL